MIITDNMESGVMGWAASHQRSEEVREVLDLGVPKGLHTQAPRSQFPESSQWGGCEKQRQMAEVSPSLVECWLMKLEMGSRARRSPRPSVGRVAFACGEA